MYDVNYNYYLSWKQDTNYIGVKNSVEINIKGIFGIFYGCNCDFKN